MIKKSLNIIDETGETVGTESREAIHNKGLLHKEVHVWFVRPNKEIVFQHRSKTKDTFPGLLDASVGGHVEIGDNYVSTAIKEILEETGLEVEESDLRLIKIARIDSLDPLSNSRNNVLRAIFVYRYNNELDKLKQEKNEGLGFESFSVEGLENLSDKARKRFVPRMISEDHILMFKDIIKT